ncbi:hypothetical protein CSOJ01_12757 [Colletotrichum sojae]|uniref:Uncharacterized protein n=1 Tax=Colletotrichum sojae TaxID=2175907 RepID=A0A8H6IUY5_9PEZI|nr:hypothetical protein CSOJ01_12757 [Colletotrichum sojae]
MDPNPAPGAVPAAAGVDKVPEAAAEDTKLETKPAEPAAAEAKPVQEKPTEGKPAAEKPAAEKPAEEKPAEEKPAEEKPAAEKPIDGKLVEENPIAEKPAEEKATEEKPVHEKPAEEKPAADKPAQDKPVAEKLAEDKEDGPTAPKETVAAPAADLDPSKDTLLRLPPSIDSTAANDGPITKAWLGEIRLTDWSQRNAEPDAAPAAAAAGAIKESVEEPVPAKDPAVEDEPTKEPIIDKPGAANGAKTKDVEMTGALNDVEPWGAGEREAAPQAVPPKTKTGEKRKADKLETNGTNGHNGASEEQIEEKPLEKKIKTGRPGRLPANGAAKAKKEAAKESHVKESPKKKVTLGHKVAKKVNKVLPPVGRTERKTRSQGPA